MPTRTAVTGAFSYTGKYVAQRLLAMGEDVVTLTNHPDRPNPFAGQVQPIPYSFDDPARLTRDLDGVDTLYNTYWVRYPHGDTTFDTATTNTATLLGAARDAGVRRVVHVSVTGVDTPRGLPYFAGKARQEDLVRQSGMSYAIVRPTIVYGLEDVLTNNITWFLRRFPLFPIPRGQYHVQPVFVGDLADRLVAAGHSQTDQVEDAAGSEVLTFAEFVAVLRTAVGSKARILPLPHAAVRIASVLMDLALRDVVLTAGEVRGLTASLLVSGTPSPCPTRFTDWVKANAHLLGRRYTSELARHF